MKTRFQLSTALVLAPWLAGWLCAPAAAQDIGPMPALAAPLAVQGNSAMVTVAAEWDLSHLAQVDGTVIQYQPAAGPEAPVDADLTYGPADPQADPSQPDLPRDATGHVPREFASHRGFFQQAGSVGTEMAILTAYVGLQSVPKLFKPTTGFHFKDEGWFGKNTQSLGMDKLTHAFNTYLIAELLHYRIHRNTNGSEGDAVTAAVLASGLMAVNEISDAIEPDSGYSMQDIIMNVTGAAFSALRNTTPGLKEKLAFKLEIVPNDQIYSHVGKKHYAQQRFMMSIKGAGFKEVRETPLRYLDLQVGYYASDFLNSDREQGIIPKRHVFFGVGLNVGELLFSNSSSRFGRAARSALDYIQLPYTSVRRDTQGEWSF